MDANTNPPPSAAQNDGDDTAGHPTIGLGDVSGVAFVAVRTGGRLGFRAVRGTYRIVRRNPGVTAGFLAGLVVAIAAARMIQQRRAAQAAVQARPVG